MSFADGSKGEVQIKGFADGSSAGALVTLCVKKWEADLKKVKHDTSSTCNHNWQLFQVGKKVVEFSIEAQLDLSNSPLSSTGADVEADYCAVKLYADGTVVSPVPFFDIPTAIVDSIKVTSMESDIITYTITGTSSGPVTINGVSGS